MYKFDVSHDAQSMRADFSMIAYPKIAYPKPPKPQPGNGANFPKSILSPAEIRKLVAEILG